MAEQVWWAGLAAAVVLAAWWLWQAIRKPYDPNPFTCERCGFNAEHEQQVTEALDVVAERCCDLHNRNCEPPSELCCEDCTEYAHPRYHPPGVTCVAPDLSPPFIERDHRKAEHMNRTLRRAEGGDEQT